MSRIVMSIEEDFNGKVIGSFDLSEYANKVRADAIDECIKFVDEWDSVIADALANYKEQNNDN